MVTTLLAKTFMREADGKRWRLPQVGRAARRARILRLPRRAKPARYTRSNGAPDEFHVARRHQRTAVSRTPLAASRLARARRDARLRGHFHAGVALRARLARRRGIARRRARRQQLRARAWAVHRARAPRVAGPQLDPAGPG